MIERSIRLDDEVYELLREIAEECDRNPTQLIRMAVNHLVGAVLTDMSGGMVGALLDYEREAASYVDELTGMRYNPEQW